MPLPCYRITAILLLTLLTGRCFGGKESKTTKTHKRIASLSSLLAASTPPPASVDNYQTSIPHPPAMVPSIQTTTAQQPSTPSSPSSSTKLSQIPTPTTSPFRLQHHDPSSTASSSTNIALVSLEEPSTPTPLPTTPSSSVSPPPPPQTAPPAWAAPPTTTVLPPATTTGGSSISTLPPILTSPIFAPETSTRQTLLPAMSFSITTLSGRPLAVAEVNHVVEQFLADFLVYAGTRDEGDTSRNESSSHKIIHLETTMFQTEGRSFASGAAKVTVRSTVTTAATADLAWDESDQGDSVVTNIDVPSDGSINADDSAEARMTQALSDYIQLHGHEMETELYERGAVLDRASWTIQHPDGTDVFVLSDELTSSAPPATAPTVLPAPPTSSKTPFLHQPGALALLIVGCVLFCMMTAPIAARMAGSVYSSASESDGDSEEDDLLDQ